MLLSDLFEVFGVLHRFRELDVVGISWAPENKETISVVLARLRLA